MIVSIQGIAPISAVGSYLRQRVSQPLSSLYATGRSDMQGMLDAYAGLLGDRRAKATSKGLSSQPAEGSSRTAKVGKGDSAVQAGLPDGGAGLSMAAFDTPAEDPSSDLAELAESSDAIRGRDEEEDRHNMHFDHNGQAIADMLDDLNDYDDDDYEDEDVS